MSGAEPVKSIVTPTRIEYTFRATGASASFLKNIAAGRIVGRRCPECEKVYVPARGVCPRCGVATAEEVEVADKGTVTTFCVVHIPVPGSPVKPPFVSATILLDGANLGLFHLVADCKPSDVRPGMRVEAVWKPREEWDCTLENIKWFKPTGEPDVEVPDTRETGHA